jgi:hypothetical protein
MRGVKAKRIRRGVYGELSQRAERKYRRVGMTMVNVGPRGLYLRMKAAAKQKRSDNVVV